MWGSREVGGTHERRRKGGVRKKGLHKELLSTVEKHVDGVKREKRSDLSIQNKQQAEQQE